MKELFEYMNVKKMKYESILFFNQNSKFYLSNEIYIIMKYILNKNSFISFLKEYSSLDLK